MYILARFNNKQYFIAECLTREMVRQLANVYNNCFQGVSFILVEDVFLTKSQFDNYRPQQEFIRDYRASHHLTKHLEHLPLDKA